MAKKTDNKTSEKNTKATKVKAKGKLPKKEKLQAKTKAKAKAKPAKKEKLQAKGKPAKKTGERLVDSRGRDMTRRPRGEKHALAKISDADIKAARKAYKSGEYTQRELAEHYGVTTGYMCLIINGKKR